MLADWTLPVIYYVLVYTVTFEHTIVSQIVLIEIIEGHISNSSLLRFTESFSCLWGVGREARGEPRGAPMGFHRAACMALSQPAHPPYVAPSVPPPHLLRLLQAPAASPARPMQPPRQPPAHPRTHYMSISTCLSVFVALSCSGLGWPQARLCSSFG